MINDQELQDDFRVLVGKYLSQRPLGDFLNPLVDLDKQFQIAYKTFLLDPDNDSFSSLFELMINTESNSLLSILKVDENVFVDSVINFVFENKEVEDFINDNLDLTDAENVTLIVKIITEEFKKVVTSKRDKANYNIELKQIIDDVINQKLREYNLSKYLKEEDNESIAYKKFIFDCLESELISEYDSKEIPLFLKLKEIMKNLRLRLEP